MAHTGIGTESVDGLFCRGLRVELPSLVGFEIGGTAALEGHVILAGNRLAVKNEEGCYVILLPLIKIQVNVCLDTGQAAESGEKRFVRGSAVENVGKVVRGIDGNGALGEFGKVKGARGC